MRAGYTYGEELIANMEQEMKCKATNPPNQTNSSALD